MDLTGKLTPCHSLMSHRTLSTNHELGMLIIKARVGEDIRRVPIHNEDITYDELLLMLQRLFPQHINSKDEVLLKYKDEDGDLITIADGSDLVYAKAYNRTLNITIFVKGRDIPALNMSSVRSIRSELTNIRDRINRLLEKVESVYPEPTKPAPSPVIAEPIAKAEPVQPTVDPATTAEFDPLSRPTKQEVRPSLATVAATSSVEPKVEPPRADVPPTNIPPRAEPQRTEAPRAEPPRAEPRAAVGTVIPQSVQSPAPQQIPQSATSQQAVQGPTSLQQAPTQQQPYSASQYQSTQQQQQPAQQQQATANNQYQHQQQQYYIQQPQGSPGQQPVNYYGTQPPTPANQQGYQAPTATSSAPGGGFYSPTVGQTSATGAPAGYYQQQQPLQNYPPQPYPGNNHYPPTGQTYWSYFDNYWWHVVEL